MHELHCDGAENFSVRSDTETAETSGKLTQHMVSIEKWCMARTPHMVQHC